VLPNAEEAHIAEVGARHLDTDGTFEDSRGPHPPGGGAELPTVS
jgi:hypothetical protein